MKVKDLTLADWQLWIDKFRADNPSAKPGVAFRVDGSQFSVGIYYGGFTFENAKYTVFGYDWKDEKGAFIGVRGDFLRWVTKKLKEAAK